MKVLAFGIIPFFYIESRCMPYLITGEYGSQMVTRLFGACVCVRPLGGVVAFNHGHNCGLSAIRRNKRQAASALDGFATCSMAPGSQTEVCLCFMDSNSLIFPPVLGKNDWRKTFFSFCTPNTGIFVFGALACAWVLKKTVP